MSQNYRGGRTTIVDRCNTVSRSNVALVIPCIFTASQNGGMNLVSSIPWQVVESTAESRVESVLWQEDDRVILVEKAYRGRACDVTW